MSSFHSFTCSCPVFPSPFIEEAVFAPLHILASFVKNKLPIGAWVYVLVFYLVPLVYISLFVPVPYCLDDLPTSLVSVTQSLLPGSLCCLGIQRIARRDKKAFLRDQCKGIEENKRMGKTKDLFKKIRDTKGIFHAKMRSIKDRNGMDLIEAEDIEKRWQEYIELYKKDLHDPDNHNGVTTHLEPDILECEVKWALETITTNKASRCDGIPVELFPILKDDAVKVLHSIRWQIWKTEQCPQDWKRSVFIPVPKKGNAKECSNYLKITLISHASKVILKIL